MTRSTVIFLALSVVLVSGTALGARFDSATRLQHVQSAAKDPVPGVDFRVPAFTYDWEVMDDQNIIVWHTRTKAYWVVLKKSDSCRDLKYERAIQLRPGVYDLDARTGQITFEYGGWCEIESVRPLDMKALRAAEKAAKKA